MTAPLGTPRTVAEQIRTRIGRGGEAVRASFMRPVMAAAINAAVEAQLRGMSDDDAFAAARTAFDREVETKLTPLPHQVDDSAARAAIPRVRHARGRSFK